MLNPHTLDVLEFPKIRERLAGLTGFSVGRELAQSLVPSTDLDEVRRRQEITTEARRLLELRANATVGGARAVRPSIRRAALGGELAAADLIDIAGTLAGG